MSTLTPEQKLEKRQKRARNDARTAWRAMTAEDREAFLAWIAEDSGPLLLIAYQRATAPPPSDEPWRPRLKPVAGDTAPYRSENGPGWTALK